MAHSYITPPRRLLSPVQVAEITGLSKKRVYWAIHTHVLPAVKFGSRFFVAEKSIDELVDKMSKGMLVLP